MSIKRIKDFPDGSGSLTNDDIFLFMDDPASTGITKKISLSQISSAIGASGIVSNTGNINGSSVITNIVQISQANYDILPTKSSSTLYIING